MYCAINFIAYWITWQSASLNPWPIESFKMRTRTTAFPFVCAPYLNLALSKINSLCFISKWQTLCYSKFNYSLKFVLKKKYNSIEYGSFNYLLYSIITSFLQFYYMHVSKYPEKQCAPHAMTPWSIHCERCALFFMILFKQSMWGSSIF